MDRLAVTALDVRVELLLQGSRAGELDTLLRRAWSRCLDLPHRRQGDPITLTLDDVPVDSSLVRGSGTLADDDADRLLVFATQSITGAAITAQAGHLLMFHAGAVSHPSTGAGLVFVAPGGTGKTTLSRTLGQRYGYLSDETVGVDRAGRILPYPKPLSIRAKPAAPHKHEFSPDELGLGTAHPKPQVARIILLERSDHHVDEPEITELPLLDAIAALAPETSSLSALDRGLAFCADLIERTGPVLRVRYAEAETIIPLAAELIGDLR